MTESPGIGASSKARGRESRDNNERVQLRKLSVRQTHALHFQRTRCLLYNTGRIRGIRMVTRGGIAVQSAGTTTATTIVTQWRYMLA